MKFKGKKIVLLSVMVLLGGCDGWVDGNRTRLKTEADPAAQTTYMSNLAVENEDQSGGHTAVESANLLRERNYELLEKLMALQAEKHKLQEQEMTRQQEVATLQKKLLQADKELAEANDLLMQMDAELKEWKHDILGFRNKMEQAEATQLKALARIIKLLGGEMPSARTVSSKIASFPTKGKTP